MSSRVRANALSASKRTLQPLVRMLIGLGVSAPEFALICKQAFVDAAAKRLSKAGKRVNRSRIAIVTGLTRAEVTRLLKSNSVETLTQQRHQHRARRVLKGWSTDPEFLSRSRRPRELVFKSGRGSFQALVKRYSGDIPPRAMMDELMEMTAIRKQKNGRIRMIARTPSRPSLSTRGVASLGSNASAFLNTLCHNLEDPSNPLFSASVGGTVVDPGVVEVLLARIKAHGTEFLNHIDDHFRHPPRGSRERKSGKAERLGVTVFVHREPATRGRGNRR